MGWGDRDAKWGREEGPPRRQPPSRSDGEEPAHDRHHSRDADRPGKYESRR